MISLKLKQNKLFLPGYINAYYWYNKLFDQGFDGINYENKSRRIWCFLLAYNEVFFDFGAKTGWFSMLAKVHNRNSQD